MSEILVFQHHPEEGLGSLEDLLGVRGHHPRVLRLDLGAVPPADLGDHGGLIIMGGPMSVNDHEQYPWLLEELRTIRRAVTAGMPTLGHCLGAQLIAKAMGGEVFPNPAGAEIGWFPVAKTAAAQGEGWWQELPESFSIFHWHGETFSLPPGARQLLSSALCAHQAFAIGHHCLALQGHPEVTAASVRAWTETMAEDLERPDVGVQGSARIREDLENRCRDLQATAEVIYRPWLEQLA